MSDLSGATLKLLSELEEASFSEQEFINQFLLIGIENLFKIKASDLFELMRKAAGFPKVQYGRVSVTIATANSPSSAVVTFPSGFFSKTPRIIVTPVTSSPGTIVLGAGINQISKNGFTAYVTRTNTTTTALDWVAVGE